MKRSSLLLLSYVLCFLGSFLGNLALAQEKIHTPQQINAIFDGIEDHCIEDYISLIQALVACEEKGFIDNKQFSHQKKAKEWKDISITSLIASAAFKAASKSKQHSPKSVGLSRGTFALFVITATYAGSHYARSMGIDHLKHEIDQSHQALMDKDPIELRHYITKNVYIWLEANAIKGIETPNKNAALEEWSTAIEDAITLNTASINKTLEQYCY